MSDCFCTKTYQCLSCERAEKKPRLITERRQKTIRKEAVCGTRAGYNKHLRLGEPTCQPCKDAQKVSTQRWQRANPIETREIHQRCVKKVAG